MMKTRVLYMIGLMACMALSFMSCAGREPQTVCFFGSSVCRGVGADSLNGYASLVRQDFPEGWEYINISVDGNNTFDLFARLEKDFAGLDVQYVVLGISLGNEGLHEVGERAVLSYRENMPRLIRMLQDKGYYVIVVNNYTRGDFNEVDYQDLCTVNLEVQQWDVTTINVCGTLDNGKGRWAEGYWNGQDIYHPNQRGHEAMASAFPPSLWEALQEGKKLPEFVSTEGDDNGVHRLSFVPEPGLQSYTLSYESNDTVFTQVYAAAQSRKSFYVNGSLHKQLDGYSESISSFVVNGTNLHQLFFYRAAMTPIEVEALAQGKFLRSSLELYCPLLQADVTNYAQTTNGIVANEQNK